MYKLFIDDMILYKKALTTPTKTPIVDKHIQQTNRVQKKCTNISSFPIYK